MFPSAQQLKPFWKHKFSNLSATSISAVADTAPSGAARQLGPLPRPGPGVNDGHRGAGVIHKQFLAGSMILAQVDVQLAHPVLVELAVAAGLVAARMIRQRLKAIAQRKRPPAPCLAICDQAAALISSWVAICNSSRRVGDMEYLLPWRRST